MGEWKTASLMEFTDVFPSNVDKVLAKNEIPIILCNYMDAYSNRFIRVGMSFSPGTVRQSELRRFRLRKGDVIVTKDSETPDDIGIPAVVSDEIDNLVCGYHLAVIRADRSKYDGTFLMYALQAEKPSRYFSTMCNGITRYGLTLGALQRQKVFMPKEKTEQSKIAEILSVSDEAIEKTKALIEKYRNIKTGLMQDLLSNGIDENGKIRTPETHAFKDSPLGRIPVEWGIQPLSSLTDKIADRNHTTPDYVKHGVYIVSPKDFDENERIDFSNCALISQQDHLINRKKTDIRPGDLIFTRIGAGLGKVCYVSDDMPEFSILHSAAMIRVNQKISATMLMYIIRSHYFQRLIEDGIQSIGVPDLGMDKINALLVKYPINQEEQQRITECLTAADEKIQTEQAYLAKLHDIKLGLMQSLLTNTVSVDPLM